MRFWPQKKWKKIVLVTLLVIIISSISFLVYMSYVINNDVVTQLVIENPTGSKTAIIFYHPGLSSFSYDISYAFADGLVSNDWRVEIATPSIEAPTDLSKYSLLVIASNTYGFNVDAPTTSQLERIEDLEGIQTVLLTLGAGNAQQSQEALENIVETSNGTILESVLIYSLAPNERDINPTEISYQTAKAIN